MIQLIPMTEAEFPAFIALSMQDQAQGHVQDGRWPAAEAPERIEKLRAQLLPAGLATPNHYFFTLFDQPAGTRVGALWYAVVERQGQRHIFVMDIQIQPEFRRRGYGTQAFRLLEAQARRLGIETIDLHVFQHNQPARAMYAKLGYHGSADSMSKTLEPASE